MALSVKETIKTPLTNMLGITHPIMLAGMNQAAGPKLAAAVTNAGGIGVVGGVSYTPKILKNILDELKEDLVDKNAPFGVDLLLPKVGGGARKTNKDYTGGKLPELLDVIIASGASLFVSAVGIPPKYAVDKLHDAGIPVMNMIGAPKHVAKCLAAGVDIICAQGGEGGGHTGDVPTSVLIPKVVDLCRGKTSAFTGKPIVVVAAGGIFDGRGLASALAMGASGVWVGTRFVAAKEAGAPPYHQKAVIDAGYHDTLRSIVFTGRPMRIYKNAYAQDWEDNRRHEMARITDRGVLPLQGDMEKQTKDYSDAMSRLGLDPADEQAVKMHLMMKARPLLMGQAAGAIDSVEPAATIMTGMIDQACAILKEKASMIARL